MPNAKKSKPATKRTKVKDLPKPKQELTGKSMRKVKGGILPYIEQDNIYKSTNITDGTSNTVKGK